MLCVNRNYSRAELAGIYRAARIGLVTPLRDGMNLVAKEYVAAQDPADPGVLVLSRFAGAARQMTDALIVNPYAPEELADALAAALAMPLRERVRRWETLMAGVMRDDVRAWRDRFVGALESAVGAEAAWPAPITPGDRSPRLDGRQRTPSPAAQPGPGSADPAPGWRTTARG
jgi:trehalose 6-phosphate synthase